MLRPEEIIEQQKLDAAKLKQNGGVPAVVKSAPPATTGVDTRDRVDRYLDEMAPSSFAGQLIKFDKAGKFVVVETGEELSPDADFVVLADETLFGWIRFKGEGVPPDRHQGLLFQGFVEPSRESLGDTDPSQWPQGLDGQPTDPWQHQICLVLQNPSTQALYTFSTTSRTGHSAVGNLLKHYRRMERQGLHAYPVVRLKLSGFQHKNKGIGWVNTPSFAVFGQAPKGSAAKPDTSVAADMDDDIPF